MKYFFVLLIFAVVFSPIVMQLYINHDLEGDSGTIDYAKREDCLINLRPDCMSLVHDEWRIDEGKWIYI